MLYVVCYLLDKLLKFDFYFLYRFLKLSKVKKGNIKHQYIFSDLKSEPYRRSDTVLRSTRKLTRGNEQSRELSLSTTPHMSTML